MPRPKPEPIEMVGETVAWRADAACEQLIIKNENDKTLGAAWIAEDGPLEPLARLVCEMDCKVRFACLIEALGDHEAQGVRAGYYFDEGGLEAPDRRRLRGEYGLEAKKRQRRPSAFDEKFAVLPSSGVSST